MFYLLAFGSTLTVDETKPVILFVNQNPMSAYYGDPAASVMSNNMPDYNIISLYVNLDFGESSSSFISQAESVAREIDKIKPKSVFIHGSGLYKFIHERFPNQRIVLFSMEPSSVNITVGDPGVLFTEILRDMSFSPDKYYVLYDDSSKSIRANRLYRKMLVQRGIKDSDIVSIKSDDINSFERNVRGLNSRPRSIIINCMYQVRDIETGVQKYIPDIKDVLTRVNSKHLELGSYKTPTGNESIVFQIDYSKIPDYFQGNLSSPVAIKVFMNLDRLDSLGYRKEYIRAVSKVDGIIK